MDFEYAGCMDHATFKEIEKRYNDHLQSGKIDQQMTFDYASCLISSQYPADVKKGLILMEELFKEKDSTNKRDYIYYLGVGNAKLREYKESLKYINALLQIEPTNTQVQHLKESVTKKMQNDALQGAAFAGGAMALGGLVGVGLMLLGSKLRK